LAGRDNHYEVLGVEPDATPDDVVAAFRRLAREMHPDRFRGSGRARAEQAFQAITEAYNVLSDPARRQEYDRQLARGVYETRSSPRELARGLAARAIALARAGDVGGAEEAFTRAVGFDPSSAKVRHLFGIFLCERAGRLQEGLRHLDQAVRTDPTDFRALVDAARMFARADMIARARRLAEQASALAPDDDAVQSLLQQLAAGSQTGPSGGATR